MYGINAVNALCLHYGADKILCVATRAGGMVENIDNLLKCKYIVGDADNDELLDFVKVDSVDLLLKTSWIHPAFERLSKRYRAAKVNTRIVMLADNIYFFSLKKIFGPLWFRIFKLGCVDAVIVPGAQSKFYMQLFGFSDSRIGVGLYFADKDVFKPRKKTKELIFVGQLIRRKGFDVLIEAWKEFRIAHKEWELSVYGQGELAHLCGTEGVKFYGHASSGEIASAISKAHALLLPSRLDHWGVVLHEAALSGAIPCASKYCGATVDLLPRSLQVYKIERVKVASLVSCLRSLVEVPLGLHTNLVRENALRYGPELFLAELARITK